MSLEKEIVFGVKPGGLPDLSEATYKNIEQVYLTPFPADPHYPEVQSGEWRIRTITKPGDEPHFTTAVKFGDKASGTRQELETIMAPGDFATKSDEIHRFGKGIVKKRRYSLPDHIDLDRFDPEIHGELWLAEREFTSDEERANWQLPDWAVPLTTVPANRTLARPLPGSTTHDSGMLLEEIALDVRKLQRSHGKVLVTISGMSGSGKTTAAAQLASFLGGNHLEADHFHIGQTALLERFGAANHDLPGTYDYRLAAQAAGKLLARQSVTLPRYDFVTSERQENVQLTEPATQPVVIVDGIYGKLVADYIEQSTDIATYNVLMNTPLYVCVLRRLLRDAIGNPASDSIERQVAMSGEETLGYLMSYAIPTYLQHTPNTDQFDGITS